MPIEIVVPRLGWSMEEGTLVQWLKKDGEYVGAGEMLFVLEGEKAAQEVESFDGGTLHIPPDAPRPGDTVTVGQLLGYLLADGESAPGKSETRAAAKPPGRNEPLGALTRAAGPAARRRARELGMDSSSSPAIGPSTSRAPDDATAALAVEPKSSRDAKRMAISPRARRAARELGVDAAQVFGSGRNGRVRERDVIAFTTRASRRPPAALPPLAPGTQRPASRIRRTIAQRMLAGVQQTAPVTLATKVDAAAMVAIRQRLKGGRRETAIPSYQDILVRLVALALPECPELNACWHADGLYYYDRINVAIAIDTDAGLVAPVLNDVASLSLEQITLQSLRLAEQARTGSLTQEQLQGGTFTITNLGMFDIDFFTPIMNLPQAAILGIGRIVREPIVVDDMVVPGYRLELSLTFDHRILDGGPAARWLQRLAKMIEDPEPCLFASH